MIRYGVSSDHLWSDTPFAVCLLLHCALYEIQFARASHFAKLPEADAVPDLWVKSPFAQDGVIIAHITQLQQLDAAAAAMYSGL